jgi:hypothetical protein
MITKYYDGLKTIEIDVPEKCPITNLPFFMMIEHSDLGLIPTYGGPYDSYTIPEKDNNGDYYRVRYDHDDGAWTDEWEYVETEEDWND